MKIILTKAHKDASGEIKRAGSVLDVSDKLAREWIAEGVAKEYRLPGPTEHKHNGDDDEDEGEGDKKP